MNESPNLSIISNKAGTSANNPVVYGLPVTFCASFRENIKGISAYVGSTTPPQTVISLTQDTEDTRLYKYTGVAGTTPLNSTKIYFRTIQISARSRDFAIVEKQMFLSPLPTDAIQVYDVVQESWVSANYDTMPEIIPVCAQMCGIRFFNSWYDEYRRPGFGGAATVSVYDYGSLESGTSRQYVQRKIDQEIEKFHYVYLEKHQQETIEDHDFVVTFKSPGTTTGVSVRVKVQTVSCLGFEIQDPQTE